MQRVREEMPPQRSDVLGRPSLFGEKSSRCTDASFVLRSQRLIDRCIIGMIQDRSNLNQPPDLIDVLLHVMSF